MYGLESLKARTTGNLPKAILCVRKNYEPGAEPAVQNGQMPDFAKKAADKAKEMMKRAEGSLFSGVSSLKATSQDFVEMEVQYNPNSITMDTQAGRQVSSSADNPNQINITKQPTATTMSFQLVFDDMNIADAFMINQGLTAGNMLTTAFSTASKLAGGKNLYSVKAKMDGIMSLLMHAATRQVIFYWAHMCFRGELTSVSSRYTMFNKYGMPVRGTIDLSIRQGDDKNLGYEESYWQKKFDKIFGVAGDNATFTDNSVGSAVQNILNLWM